MDNEISSRLRWLRNETQVAQRELAWILGLQRTAVSGFECGYSLPRPRNFSAIADVFGVTLDWLLRGIGPEPDPEHVRACVAAARARYEASVKSKAAKKRVPVKKRAPAKKRAAARRAVR